MREMKDSGVAWIGKIPKEWEIKRIKSIYKERTELSEDGTERLLSVSEYYGIAPTDEKVNSNDYLSRSESLIGYKKCFKDDFVSNIMLAWKGSFGTTKYDGIVSPAYCVYKPSKEIAPSFYHYLFRTDLYKLRFKSFSKGIIDSRLRLYSPYFYMVEAIYPPLPEQQRIATFLDEKCKEIDDLMALQEEMITELQAYKQSVITEAVTKGLNPNAPMKDSGIDWNKLIPKGWVTIKLKYLVNLKSGSNLTSYEINDNGKYPVYGGNGIRGFYDQFSNEGNYVLIGRQGALCGNINYTNGKFWVTEHALVCYPKCKFIVFWLGELLKAMNLNQYSLSAAQPGLSAERIMNLYIPVPPLSEQQAIADYLDTQCSHIDKLIALKRTKIEELQDYKKSVIYEYVTGKKEVPATV